MNLEQLRAQSAFAFVQEIVGKDKQARRDFLGLARTLPVMLQTNGLFATWAHLLAKAKKNEHRRALEALLLHLRAAPLRLVPGEGDAEEVFAGLWRNPASPASGSHLRRLTAEAIAFSVWLKRAAEALLDEGEGGAADTGRARGAPAAGGGHGAHATGGGSQDAGVPGSPAMENEERGG